MPPESPAPSRAPSATGPRLGAAPRPLSLSRELLGSALSRLKGPRRPRRVGTLRWDAGHHRDAGGAAQSVTSLATLPLTAGGVAGGAGRRPRSSGRSGGKGRGEPGGCGRHHRNTTGRSNSVGVTQISVTASGTTLRSHVSEGL